jgi:hypothetical protein
MSLFTPLKLGSLECINLSARLASTVAALRRDLELERQGPTNGSLGSRCICAALDIQQIHCFELDQVEQK